MQIYEGGINFYFTLYSATSINNFPKPVCSLSSCLYVNITYAHLNHTWITHFEQTLSNYISTNNGHTTQIFMQRKSHQGKECLYL